MTQEESEKFVKTMTDYARKRIRGHPDWVEEFPAFAWEQIFVKQVKCGTYFLFKRFIASKIGPAHSTRRKMETEKSELRDDDGPHRWSYEHKSKAEAMISLLGAAGYSKTEILEHLFPFIRGQKLRSRRQRNNIKTRLMNRKTISRQTNWTQIVFESLAASTF